MTPEQTAEKYAQEHGDICESIWDGERLAENAFLAGHAHAEQERWVKLTPENLPQPNREVYVCMVDAFSQERKLFVDRASIMESGTWYSGNQEDIILNEITYWMYHDIPQPPEHG